MSWTATGTRPTMEPALTLTGTPRHSLLRLSLTRLAWGLWSPAVAALPNELTAPLPLAEVVPPSSASAMAGAAAIATPATDAESAAAARYFFMKRAPDESDCVTTRRARGTGLPVPRERGTLHNRSAPSWFRPVPRTEHPVPPPVTSGDRAR